MRKPLLKFLVALTVLGVSGGSLAAGDGPAFEKLDTGAWEEVLHDSGTGDWRRNWTLDGLTANITNGADGMHFASGPEEGNHADHAVLWTRESFAGDVRIDFLYTRTDEAIRNVNIIYVQATGSGEGEFAEDIMAWRHLREEPWMKNYFRTMNLYHISFAAFGTKNIDPEEDYIRARRYMPTVDAGLGGTDLKPDYARTGLFRTGVTYRVTVIKQGRELRMRVMDGDRAFYCHWRNESLPAIEAGRVGLRHMYARSARYQNFSVSVRPKVR
ncbi:MAG: DUF1961 family protein [Opitutaceae bacterium]|jgi:hypothetical protein|nr:DUF1961 family protein [Opitutaceae bacterium]